MKKYRVYFQEVITYEMEIEAEDKNNLWDKIKCMDYPDVEGYDIDSTFIYTAHEEIHE